MTGEAGGVVLSVPDSTRQLARWLLTGSVAFLLAFSPAFAQTPPPKTDPQLDRIARWLNSKDESVRLEAVRELSQIRKPEAADLLLKALADTSASVRGAAAWTVESAPDPRIVSKLRDLLSDQNEQVRAAAVWSLSHTGGSAVLPDVIRLGKDDPSSVVRFRAVWGLAFIGDKSALPAVIDALGDSNPSVRERSALLALEKLADATVGKRLLEMKSHPSGSTRRLVMYLLYRYGDSAAVPALVEGLKDFDPLVRGQAALSLGKLRAKSALVPLISLLKDPDEHVRGSAAYAVGLVGDRSAAKDLRPLSEDQSAFVRAVTAESLQRLGDKTATPPDGFKAEELFTFPIYSPEHADLYR